MASSRLVELLRRVSGSIFWTLALVACAGTVRVVGGYLLAHPEHPFAIPIGALVMAAAAGVPASLLMMYVYITGDDGHY